MKKILVVVLVIALAMIGASAAMAAVLNSKHDLSSTSSATIKASAAGLSACQFCHTPHLGTNNVVVGAPLWNRSISAAASFLAADGSTNYQVYGNTVTNASGTTLGGSVVGAPGPNSKTCLSCHDGTLSLGAVLVGTAVTTFNDYTAGARLTGSNKLTGGPAAIGTDLTQEHPIGVAVAVTPSVAGLDTRGNMETDGAKFYGGSFTMECGTCHDPHETAAGKTPFLRMTKATMCTDCHISK